MKKGASKKFDFLGEAAINELILFAISAVKEKREKCIFERLTKECFSLFPSVFSLAKYPKWPDTRKLDRPLRILRERKLVEGDPKTSFSLTVQGEKEAQSFAKTFCQEKLL